MEKMLKEILNEVKGIKVNQERMEERFEQLENRFDQLENRFDQLESRFDQLESRFDQLDVKVETNRQMLIKIDDRLINVEKYIENNKSEMNLVFRKLSDHDREIQIIKEKIGN